MRRTIALWVALFWLGVAGAALAQPAPDATQAPAPIVLTSQKKVPLDGQSRFWIDTGGSFGIDQVEAAADSLPWTTRQAGQQYRIDGKALWFQFDAVASREARWYLELASSGLDRAQLFYRTADGSWDVQEAGDTKPVSQWPLPGRVPTFELPEGTGEPVRYWLRIEHARVNFAVPAAIYSQGALLASRESEQFLLGAYFGLAALIAVVAAANAFVFRDRNFFSYAVYVLAISAGQVAYLGVGAQHIWDDWLKWNEIATFILPGVSTAIGLWFVKVVTEPARFSKVLDLAVWSLIAAMLSAVALDTFLASRASFALVMGLTAIALVTVVALITLVWTQGDDPHIRLIALGFLPVIVMAVFPIARGLNLIPNSSLTRYGLSIGAALEMPILFYALSLRGARRREAQVRTSALSHSDALTGLADAATLGHQLDGALVRARSQKHSCALLGLRIANFDAITSEYGRDAGDRALVVAASLLRHAITDIDRAARVGDHAFAVLLDGPTTSEVAVARAQQIVAAGLRHSRALPPGISLKFHVILALLPDREQDAAGIIRWVMDAVAAMPPDARKLIRPLNF